METTKQTSKNEIRTENAEMLYGAFLMSTEGLSDTERKACAEEIIGQVKNRPLNEFEELIAFHTADDDALEGTFRADLKRHEKASVTEKCYKAFLEATEGLSASERKAHAEEIIRRIKKGHPFTQFEELVAFHAADEDTLANAFKEAPLTEEGYKAFLGLSDSEKRARAEELLGHIKNRPLNEFEALVACELL